MQVTGNHSSTLLIIGESLFGDACASWGKLERKQKKCNKNDIWRKVRTDANTQRIVIKRIEINCSMSTSTLHPQE